MEVAAPVPFAQRAARAAAAVACSLLFTHGAALAEDAAAGKVLRVATSGDYAPFSFEAGGSALEGFDIEVANRFAKDRGYRVEIVRFQWPELSRELAAGSFDVAMSGVTVRVERSIAGRYSVPVAATQAVVTTWKGSGIETMADVDKPGRRIAVNAGGHLEKVANGAFRRAEVLAIPDNAAVRMTLLDRTADAVLTDNFEEKVWTASAPDAVRLGSLSDDRKAYLLPAGRAELAAELDRWLIAHEKDGTLAELRKKYFRNADGSEVTSGDETAPTAEPVAALAAAVRERMALMPLVYEAKKRDGKPIEDKAQEAAVLDGGVRAVAAEAAAVAGVAAVAGSARGGEAPAIAAGEAGAGAAGNAPDEAAVRDLFDALISIGKDVQQKLADADARQRRGNIIHRPADASKDGEKAGVAEPAPRDPDLAKNPPAPEEAAPEQPAPPRNTGPDLARDLRPAIARITEKIARIVVAMDEPVSERSARSGLEASLSSQGVKAERLDAMASAVARISSRSK